jgi:hypothetical protein
MVQAVSNSAFTEPKESICEIGSHHFETSTQA